MGISGKADVSPAAAEAAEGDGDEVVPIVEGIEALGLPQAELEFRECLQRNLGRVVAAAVGKRYKDLHAAARDLRMMLQGERKLDMVKERAIVMTILGEGCGSGRPSVTEQCIDCINRLIEHGYIGGGCEPQYRIDDSAERLAQIVDLVCSGLETQEDSVYLRVIQALLSLVKKSDNGLHGNALLSSIRTIYNVYLNTQLEPVRTSARASLDQIVEVVFGNVEKELVPKDPSSQETAVSVKEIPENNPAHESPFQKDAYFLFRALSKLANKEEEEGPVATSTPTRSRILSLGLLLLIAKKYSHVLESSERFVYGLRHHLAPALVNNGMSSFLSVSNAALDVFDELVLDSGLRPLLKAEIAAIFETVIFRYATSSSVTYARRKRSLSTLKKICRDQNALVDIFVNYDCDLHGQNIFEKTVKLLCEVANDTVPKQQKAAGEQEEEDETSSAKKVKEYRLDALEAISEAFESIRHWSEPLEKEKFGTVGRKSIEARTSNKGLDPTLIARELSKRTTQGGAFMDGDDQDAEHFQETIRRKKQLESGISLFNAKPKKGITFLMENKLMSEKPIDIAKFLMTTDGLDATAIGEYLGESDEFAVSVMKAYTDLQDFSKVKFDDGIRIYLATFRLPGEAQKIDRIMEKFASRYCECNPKIFASADTAYVLAYSVIMLNTDAHNPQVKKKMTKEEFIRINQGIDDSEDLDRQMLEELYDRIITDEIKLSGVKVDKKSQDALHAALGLSDVSPSSARARLFKNESEQLLQHTKVEFAKRKASPQTYVYYRATNVHHARLMFNVSWEPVLKVAADNLQKADQVEDNSIARCIAIFECSLAIASTFGMEAEGLVFIGELSSCWQDATTLQAKHIHCMRTILSARYLEGENLRKVYAAVVGAASTIESIRSLAQNSRACFLRDSKIDIPNRGRNGKDGTNGANGSASAHSRERTESLFTELGLLVDAESSENASKEIGQGVSTSKPQRVISKTAVKAVNEIPSAEVDSIFESTESLSLASIVCLSGALADEALKELDEEEPRSFCLQKIVTITNQNMDSKTRYQWTKIWEQLGKFFEKALSHVNSLVSFYACEVLTHLASKFLEKDELTNYSFQKSFLNPFERSFQSTSSMNIRVHILRAMVELVEVQAVNIKSGWKSAFNVLGYGASSDSLELVEKSFSVLEHIVNTYVGVLDDIFVVSIGSIVAFINNSQSKEVALKAIEYLSNKYTSLLVDGRALSNVQMVQVDEGEKPMFTDDHEEHISAWFPVLLGLSANVKSVWPDIVSESIRNLFLILDQHGDCFTAGLWTLIYRGILNPVFDDLNILSQTLGSNKDAHHIDSVAKWVEGTGKEALFSFCKLLTKHRARNSHLFGELIALVHSWATQESESISRDGISALRLLAVEEGDKHTSDEWDQIIDVISATFKETMPYEILRPTEQVSGIDDITNAEQFKDMDVEIETTVEEGTELLSPGSSRGDRNVRSVRFADESDADRSSRKSMPRSGTSQGESSVPEVTTSERLADDEIVAPANHMESAMADLPPSGFSVRHGQAASRNMAFKVVRGKCVAQLLLITLAQDVVDNRYVNLSTQQILRLVDSIWRSYEFAHKFNASVEQRFALWRTGFMNQVPNLVKQETSGMLATIRILMWLYCDCYKDPKASALVSVRFLSVCEDQLRTFSDLTNVQSSKAEDRRELLALTPIVLFILKCFDHIPTEEFKKNSARFFDIFLDTADSDVREVRAAAVNLVRVRLGASHGYVGEKRENFISRALVPRSIREDIIAVSGHADMDSKLLKDNLATVSGVLGVRSEQIASGQIRLYLYGKMFSVVDFISYLKTAPHGLDSSQASEGTSLDTMKLASEVKEPELSRAEEG